MKSTYCKHIIPLEIYCPHCEIEKLKDQLAAAHRAAEESAKDAYKRGWEQCQRGCYEIVERRRFVANPFHAIRIGIANMEYKEKSND